MLLPNNQGPSMGIAPLVAAGIQVAIPVVTSLVGKWLGGDNNAAAAQQAALLAQQQAAAAASRQQWLIIGGAAALGLVLVVALRR